MSKSVLIVESHNDKFFIERLLRHLNIQSALEVSRPICSIDEYVCLPGLSVKALERKLNEVYTDIEKKDLGKIGILVDADAVGIGNRLSEVNEALASSQFAISLPSVNQAIVYGEFNVAISCHIVNIDGYGELETILKAIASGSKQFVNCLDDWRQCLKNNDSDLSDKHFNKFWLNIYQRYDSCSKRERTNPDKDCSFQASLDKDIWNFEHTCLEELKAYLRSFV